MLKFKDFINEERDWHRNQDIWDRLDTMSGKPDSIQLDVTHKQHKAFKDDYNEFRKNKTSGMYGAKFKIDYDKKKAILRIDVKSFGK